MGGEKKVLMTRARCSRGSPPHGRGKDICRHTFAMVAGITPARAGKRQTAAMPRTMTRDHPRVGGEKSCSRSIIMRRKGSPPHGRGKEGAQLAEKTGIRITPAWAGKSGSGLLFHRVWWEHPRVGGEKAKIQLRTAKRRGSPPHGRGKVHSVFKVRKHHRITPA